ncbi:MAG: hypothetical protein AB1490_01585 [Pseudomonadota bacterium]
MPHRFAVGEDVEYRPTGGQAGHFKVVRQMPMEHLAIDLRYRIKSTRETFERNVMECDLKPYGR